MYPVAILVGGLATRLRPITEKIPKALVPVGGEPFILHQLRLLKNRGFSDVVICAWYRGEMIREVVGNGTSCGLHVQYSFDGETPLGTAGAIKKAIPLLGKQFFTLYGDSYLPCNYRLIEDSFSQQSKNGLMTVFKNEAEYDKSNVLYENGRIIKYDKVNYQSSMKHIDYGIGMFTASAFDGIEPDTNSDLAHIYQALLAKNDLAAFEVHERYYEVGSFSGLKELDQLLSNNPNFAFQTHQNEQETEK